MRRSKIDVTERKEGKGKEGEKEEERKEAGCETD